MDFDLLVIGGGAAGFYGAIQASELHPGLRVIIVEKSNKLLSKVRVSGGGRCNVTHHCFDPAEFSQHYPRGGKALRAVFRNYGATETVAWFASKGVQLKAEQDGRMFPQSDSSQTIIDCFLQQARNLNIRIEMGESVEEIIPGADGLQIACTSGKKYSASRVLIATGGSPKPDAYRFIEKLGHTIRPPRPSLFTFNDAGKLFTDLMGITVANAEIRIASTKFKMQGPLLITHWGLSGPAVIRLSAWAAEHLHDVHYNFTALVSWIGPAEEEKIREFLRAQKTSRMKQKIYANPLFELPQRLWVRLCELSQIPEEKVWGEAAHKHLNKLLENLIKCPFHIKGKTTFKEEFVTCGGVDLSEVNLENLESKKVNGVFFAGEVLDIDGETGGFNFQSAWSTAYLAARSCFPLRM
ncbi:MAG TPA: NAD(P)/FAD-dependent oxidoreductase [Chryseosolibacter sp.]|nr:NAD(P)/FAD-dependent oxidoreductase [Chryseosolibacter sp.]